MKKHLPFSMFVILAGPAHVWLWICARLCGGTFSHGPGDNLEDLEDLEDGDE